MKSKRKSIGQMDVNHLHLHVKDLARSKRFYESYFGFRERIRHGKILFLRNADGFDLALVPDPRPSSFPEWFHFGFRLRTPLTVRKLHTRMSSEGVRIHDLQEEDAYVTFQCKDPDGCSIEIYWE